MHVSKSYERRLRFSIKNKIKTLTEMELPLLRKALFQMEDCLLQLIVTPLQKIVTSKSKILAPFYKTREPWPGFGPGTFALPRQRSTRLSYQGFFFFFTTKFQNTIG